jgi:hypothetical protein
MNHKGDVMKRTVLGLLSMCFVLGWVVTASAQAAAGPAGHWEGTIQAPGQPLAIEVDLIAGTGDKWEGTITIPAQNVKAFPLSALTVHGDVVSFAMKSVPGEPLFKGTLAKDARSITGDFTQGGMTMPFTLTWKREAKLEPLAKSTPISTELEGTWEGTLDTPGAKLRLVLKLANLGGAATGTLVSVDQGGVELPVAPIMQTASHVKLSVGPVNGTYEGDLQDGRIAGTWTQGPATFPLVFTRQTK